MSVLHDDEVVRERTMRLAELGLLTSALLHELKQPLFALQVTAEVAAQHAPGERAWRQVLERTSEIRDLLERFAGIGHDGAEDEVVDLDLPIRTALDTLDPRVRQVGAHLKVDLAGGLPVRAQLGALRQVALNLVGNAIDAVEPMTTREVSVRTTRTATSAVLEVRDSGPGVPREVMGRVFEPFVTSKPVGRGTGLGLFVTRVLVDRAGGSVTLLSAAGGTTVRVELPLA